MYIYNLIIIWKPEHVLYIVTFVMLQFFVPLPQYEWEFLLFNLSFFQYHFNPHVEHLYTLQFFPPAIQRKENNTFCLSCLPLADSSTDRAFWHCSTSTRVERPGATRWMAIFAVLKACTIHRNDVQIKRRLCVGLVILFGCDVVMCVCVFLLFLFDQKKRRTRTFGSRDLCCIMTVSFETSPLKM